MIRNIDDYGLHCKTVLCLEKQMQVKTQTEQRKVELPGGKMDNANFRRAINSSIVHRHNLPPLLAQLLLLYLDRATHDKFKKQLFFFKMCLPSGDKQT